MLGRIPLIICVTGKMAAGKNYICTSLEKEGWLSLDMDRTAHEAISLCRDRILEAFKENSDETGIDLLNPDGSVNRRALGKLVFSSPVLLKKQEDIIYPKIISLTEDFIRENSGRNLILNATVLFKVPELLKKCSKILFVTAPFIKRLIRARRRDGLPYRQILSRFSSQKDLLADYTKAAGEAGIPLEIIKN